MRLTLLWLLWENVENDVKKFSWNFNIISSAGNEIKILSNDFWVVPDNLSQLVKFFIAFKH